MHWKRSYLAMFLGVILAVGTFAQLSPARADGTCAPFSQYYASCVYYTSPSQQPFYQKPNDYLWINLIIDSGLPSHMVTDIDTAANNWNTSGAFVRLLTTFNSSVGNDMYIYGSSTAPHGGTWNNTCGSIWGQSWNGSPSDTMYQSVALNSNLFNGCIASNGTTAAVDPDFIGVIVHEMGHAMGMAHNNFAWFNNGTVGLLADRMYNGPVHEHNCTLSGCPKPCDEANTSSTAYTTCPYQHPAPEDYWLFNQIYPQQSKWCNQLQSDNYCDGMDPNQQSCNGTQLINPQYNPYGWVKLMYSSNCQTNWTSGSTSVSGWEIYRVAISRQSGTDGGALTSEDLAMQTSWYTNMLYSPHNKAQACISYIRTDGSAITPFYCTGWY